MARPGCCRGRARGVPAGPAPGGVAAGGTRAPPGSWLAEALGRSASTHAVPSDFGSQLVFRHSSIPHRCPTGPQGTTYLLPPALGALARRAGRWFQQSPSLPSPSSLHVPCPVGSGSSAPGLPIPGPRSRSAPCTWLGPAPTGSSSAPGLLLPGELGALPGALQTAPGYSR